MNIKKFELDPNKSMWGASLVGIGIMAGVDTIIFHQILSWHHFYDRSTTEISLLSDGLLHAAELIALVAGFFILMDLRRNKALMKSRAWAGFFIGMGGFQLFDGIINHKVLRLHQIRYVDNILTYDIIWNVTAVILLIIGFIIYKKSNHQLQSLKPSY